MALRKNFDKKSERLKSVILHEKWRFFEQLPSLYDIIGYFDLTLEVAHMVKNDKILKNWSNNNFSKMLMYRLISRDIDQDSWRIVFELGVFHKMTMGKAKTFSECIRQIFY